MIDKFLSNRHPSIWVTTSENNQEYVLTAATKKGDSDGKSLVLHLTVEDDKELFAYVASAMVQIDEQGWGKQVFVDSDILDRVDSEIDRLEELGTTFNSSMQAAMDDQGVKEDVLNLLDIIVLMIEEHNYSIHFVKGEN